MRIIDPLDTSELIARTGFFTPEHGAQMPRFVEVDSVIPATFSLDPHGRVNGWSRAAEQTEGYRPEEIIGRHSACFYTPDEVSHGIPERDLKAAADGGVTCEGWRVRRDGSRFWAQTTIRAVRNPDGVLTGFTLEVREAQTSQLSRAALDSLAEQICVLDRDGIILFTNLAWIRAEKAHEMEMVCGRVGANYLELCRGKTGPFLSHAEEGLARVLSGVTRYCAFDYPCGPAERRSSCHVIVQPLYQSNGAIVVHADATGTAYVAEKIWRAEKHYNVLIDSPFETAALLAPDGTVEYQSPAAADVLGLQAEEIQGRRIFQFLHPQDAAPVRKMLQACMRHPQRRYRLECRLRNRDGSWRIVEGAARKASAAGMIALHSRDVTGQRLAQAALLASHAVLAGHCEDAGAVLSRLFNKSEDERRQLAHQLSFGLGRRLASLSLEAGSMASGAHAAVQLRTLQESLASLGHELRSFAAALDPEVSDATSLAAALRRLCSGIGRQARIEIEYSRAALPPGLPGPAACALYRVAEESLHNLAAHAGTKTASVSLRGTAKGVRLRIRDHGHGFDCTKYSRSPGLLTMRAQLRQVNGTLRISSRASRGTEILAGVPLPPSAARPE
ncbi:MAG TPA: PAS domain S-box protein [Bryobacteraceae bacterium]|nr:PAS domain S-box protein [Bryobacteraceae bacterium]